MRERHFGSLPRLLAVVALLQHVSPALALPPLCTDACEKSLYAVRFTDVEAGAPAPEQICRSGLHHKSMYLCLGLHCSDGDVRLGLDGLNETCAGTLPPWSIVAGYTDDEVARIERIESTVLPPGLNPRGKVILPSDELYAMWEGTLDSVRYVKHHHHTYGWAMSIFWAVVVVIGLGNRFANHLRCRRGHPSHAAWDRIKADLVIPATFGGRTAQSFGPWGTLPPRIQSLSVFSFLLLNVVLSICGYRYFPGNLYFPSMTKQVLRYLSDRTGIISFATFPVIWLFGMRNNVVLWVTGWDFATYNNFHRWAARISTLQAVVHSIGYTVIILREGGWTYFAWWWGLWFWWAGQLATIIMCFLLAFSFYWIRRQQYEIFLALHILLSVLLLFFMLGYVLKIKRRCISTSANSARHVSIFNGQYDLFVWIPLAIWALDRVARTGRILLFNRRFWKPTSKLTYNPTANMVRLSVPCSNSMYKVQPGTYYYLMMLNGANVWESHPFTVASMPPDMGTNDDESLGEEDAPLLGLPPLSGEKHAQEIGFLIRPYDSFTSRLRDAAAGSWPDSIPARIAVEGPYGHSRPLHRFTDVCFIVGGSGIVVPLSYMQKLLRSPQVRRVHVHWSVREQTFASEVLEQDLGHLLPSAKLSVSIYMTSSASAAEGARVGAGFPRVDVQSRRIDSGAVVAAAAEQAGKHSLAVIACGPAEMSDRVRRAAVGIMSRGDANLEYFEESFQW